jgi:hypothetical protein
VIIHHDRWIAVEDVLADLQELLGLGRGAAENRLKTIRASGDVRMFDPQAVSGEYPVLGAEVHGDNVGIPLPHGLLINESDFDWWLDRHSKRAGTMQAEGPPAARQTAEEAAKEMIVTWLQAASGMSRTAVFAKAQLSIPDLQHKEFDRAWRAVPAELKRGPGRPGKTLRKNPPI